MNKAKRNFIAFRDPDGSMRFVYWVLRGASLSLVVRTCLAPGTTDAFIQLHGNFHILASYYYAQLFISNIARTVFIKHPRTMMFIRWPWIVEFKFRTPGDAELMSKGFLKSTHIYYSNTIGKKYVSKEMAEAEVKNDD